MLRYDRYITYGALHDDSDIKKPVRIVAEHDRSAIDPDP
jgi:hypothetical protein